MKDRDSLPELFEILSEQTGIHDLPLTASALPYIRSCFGNGCDVYLRRRLSVCRMLVDLHVPVSGNQLDTLIAVALCHHLPGDHIPAGHDETLRTLFCARPEVSEILSVLRQTDYSDKSYYARLIVNKYALLIRLVERGVLVETLYEWSSEDARRYIQETRESFFPMCIYAKEDYPEFLGITCILMEKTRNLVTAYDALITRYTEAENALSSEILSIREENASIRAMIRDIKNSEA